MWARGVGAVTPRRGFTPAPLSNQEGLLYHSPAILSAHTVAYINVSRQGGPARQKAERNKSLAHEGV
jgi:hypothetical protein